MKQTQKVISGLILVLFVTACSMPGVYEASPTLQDNLKRTHQSKRQLMVMLPLTEQKQLTERVHTLIKSYPVKQVTAWPLKAIDLYCIVFEVEQDIRPQDIAQQIISEPGVDSVQAIRLFQVLSATKQEPFLHLQHGLRAIDVPRAHQVATGNNVRIAIIDSGIDIKHPELHQRIAEVRSFVDMPPHTYTRDIHGTAVAGVVAAEAGNQTGIVGVAPGARLLALKACWQTRREWGKAYCNSFSLAAAIDFAIMRKAAVINLSLGGPHDPIIERLIKKAMAEGIAIVAAGSLDRKGQIRFPGSMPGVIAVDSEAAQQNKFVDAETEPAARLTAPGTDILSTAPGEAYDFFSGSSLATAFVTGTTALLLEHHPELSPAEIQALLTKSAVSSSVSKGKIINACQALTLLFKKEVC